MEDKEKLEREIESYQQQLLSIMDQKEKLKLMINSAENALNELKNSSQNECFIGYSIGYQSLGLAMSYLNVFVKKSKEDVIKKLEEEKELMEIKVKSLENTENRIKEKLKEIQSKI